jgi:hypothetical protein
MCVRVCVCVCACVCVCVCVGWVVNHIAAYYYAARCCFTSQRKSRPGDDDNVSKAKIVWQPAVRR